MDYGPWTCQLLEYCIQQLAYETVSGGFVYYMDEDTGDLKIEEAGREGWR